MFDDNDHNNTRNDQKIDPVNYLITIIIDIKIRNYHCNLVNYVKYLMTEITSKLISMISVIELIIHVTMITKIKVAMSHVFY